ncbi:hypothetical protein [Sediminitomix flava]|uniref:Lipocalin-like protein n=1 Tax=Sediminitomix flava TaxID=379075 RepID=A0A315Z717_SEDFL|nr:hypothetical protein [Sediminitomix flava]PWJ40113.1 hypothetical protein BC781_105177 [Sediminitomix flava]
MIKNIKLQTIILLTIFGLSSLFINESFAQSKSQLKKESILSKKKWTVTDVSRKKLGKAKKMDDFPIEIGNELNFSIDKKMGWKNNNHDYLAGKWVLDRKHLYIIHDERSLNNRLVSVKYKVVKLKDNKIVLKRLTKPKGKIKLI